MGPWALARALAPVAAGAAGAAEAAEDQAPSGQGRATPSSSVSYTHSDAADDPLSVDLGGHRTIKKKTHHSQTHRLHSSLHISSHTSTNKST